jgi:putative transposase
MASPPRTVTAGTFFITAITHNRRRLFQVDPNARLFLETLQHYRAKNLYKLHAFVVMPDHIHLLMTTGNISEAVRHIKGGFSRRLGSKLPAWQHGFTDHLVLDSDQFRSRRDYIHQNPIRAGLVASSELYPYSSAYPKRVDLPTLRPT